MYYSVLKTPLCDIILTGDTAGLQHLHLKTGKEKRPFEILPDWEQNPNYFKETEKQILEYLSGNRRQFTIRLNPSGTDFQKKVWQALCDIPYGALRSYGEIAKAIGNPKASRAVGGANGKNPIPLIIPCHRVVGSDGSLTGFSSGIAIKEKLIQLEETSLFNDVS